MQNKNSHENNNSFIILLKKLIQQSFIIILCLTFMPYCGNQQITDRHNSASNH